LADAEPGVRAQAARALRVLEDRDSYDALMQVATADADVSARYEASRALYGLGHPRGRELLEGILERRESPDFIKRDAFLSDVRRTLETEGPATE